MTDKPLVSIVIPVYNTEKFLPQCLNSVLMQTYTDIEVVCVNDGSLDKSGDILKDYESNDKRVKVVSIENRGLSGARNEGLNHCSGDYLLFVDSDDWIDNNTIEVALENAINYKADIVLWNYVKEYSKKSVPVDVFNQLSYFNEDDFVQLYQQLIGLTGERLKTPSQCDSISTAWGKLYRTQIIKDNAIQFVDTRIIGTEDLLFNAEYFGFCKTAVAISNRFNHYRKQNSSSLTHGFKPQLFQQWSELQRRLFEKCGDKDFLTQSLSNRIALSFIGLGLNEMKSPKSLKTRTHNLKMVLSTPQYKMALKNLDRSYMPFHWKLFFFCAKNRLMVLVVFMLFSINQILMRR